MKKTNLLSKAEMKKVQGGNGGCMVHCPMGDACCDASQSGGPICGCVSTMFEIPASCSPAMGNSYSCSI